VFSSGSAPVSTGTTAQTPKAIATISSGCLRRHSSAGSNPTATTTETTGDWRSVRSAPSTTATTASTPTSTQSRQARSCGCGGRGSSHTDRRRSCTDPSYEHPPAEDLIRVAGARWVIEE
jgi:hypothetical protein